MPAGVYEVHITGSNLNEAELDCVADGGDTAFELLGLRVTESMATYQIVLDSEVDALETRIHNRSSETVVLTSLTISSVLVEAD